MKLTTQLEHDLFGELQSLLGCCELNMDDMEGDTRTSIKSAVDLVTPIEEEQTLLDKYLDTVRRFVQCDNDASDAIDFISQYVDENFSKTITISIKGGVVTNVDNVPDGWDTVIDDQD